MRRHDGVRVAHQDVGWHHAVADCIIDAVLDFDRTLVALQAWLGQHVVVAISPIVAAARPLQVAMFSGVLSHAIEPPEQAQAVYAATGGQDAFFFFVGDGERNHFVLMRDGFQLAEQQTLFGCPAIAIRFGDAVNIVVVRGDPIHQN